MTKTRHPSAMEDQEFRADLVDIAVTKFRSGKIGRRNMLTLLGALGLVTLTVWELRVPGGAPRRGVFGIDTTRGDRLFISMLGTAFIMLAWLAMLGTPLWGALAVAAVYWLGVFRYV